MFTQEKGLSMFFKCHLLLKTLRKEKSKGRIVNGGPCKFFKFTICEYSKEWLQQVHKFTICVLVNIIEVSWTNRNLGHGK